MEKRMEKVRAMDWPTEKGMAIEMETVRVIRKHLAKQKETETVKDLAIKKDWYYEIPKEIKKAMVKLMAKEKEKVRAIEKD
jgi:hypothetical protein